MKYNDMPPGNDLSPAYNMFAGNIARGRSVAVVFVRDENGRNASYVYSGEAEIPLDEANSIRHCLAICNRARDAAEARGNHPIEIDPSSLV